MLPNDVLLIEKIKSKTFVKTSSPKGNDRSPESNVPMSNLILKKMDPINSNPEKVEASIFLTMKAGLLHS